jgi:very-short-patch-repair endonuclease
MNAEEKLAKLARTQYGVFSRAQAGKAGFSESAMDRRVRTRRWEPMLPGVYRLRGVPETWHQKLMAAQLWAGTDAVVSHRSAGELLGLDGAPAGFVELTVSERRHAPPGIILHQSNDLPRSDCAKVGPITVTNVTRTCIDLGAVTDEEVVELVTEDALRRRRTTIDKLYRKVEGLACKGRRGVAMMKRFLDQRQPDARATDTGFETRLFRLIRQHGFPLPQRQVTVTDRRGMFVARVDLAYPEIKLVIECDSYKYHSSRSGWEKDHKRGNPIVAAGWGILRATWGDLTNSADFLQALGDTFASAG